MALTIKNYQFDELRKHRFSSILLDRAFDKWDASKNLPRKKKKAMRKDALLGFYFSEL